MLVLVWGILLAFVASFGGLLVCSAVDKSDKRECRRTGGQVVNTDHDEWHCVPVTPERAR